MAEKKKTKSKSKKKFSSGIAHVVSSFNNTIITITDDNGNEYEIYVDDAGRIVNVLSSNNTITTPKKVTELPDLKISSKTGSGAILKPSIKVRPPYQGEVKQVIDCVS